MNHIPTGNDPSATKAVWNDVLSVAGVAKIMSVLLSDEIALSGKEAPMETTPARTLIAREAAGNVGATVTTAGVNDMWARAQGNDAVSAAEVGYSPVPKKGAGRVTPSTSATPPTFMSSCGLGSEVVMLKAGA